MAPWFALLALPAFVALGCSDDASDTTDTDDGGTTGTAGSAGQGGGGQGGGGQGGGGQGGAPSDCGNAAIDTGEDCDGANLGGEDCVGLGFVSGTLACDASCMFDTSGCVGPVCGDGAINGTEDCEAGMLGGADCMSEGFDGGTLDCNGGSCQFDTSGCYDCGDNVVGGSETCDGVDLAGESCLTQGFLGGGTLLCAATCDAFDTTGCIAVEDCDNGLEDDGDMLTDCADPDCLGDPACAPIEMIVDCTSPFCTLTAGAGPNGGDLCSCTIPGNRHPLADDAADPVSGCFLASDSGYDLLFQFTTVPVAFSVSTCNANAGDSSVAAFDGDPSVSGAELGCDDDAAGEASYCSELLDNPGGPAGPVGTFGATELWIQVDEYDLNDYWDGATDRTIDIELIAVAPAEVCTDGIDNDVDGDVDCDDSDCAADPTCPPPTWTCNPAYYAAADGCDCGCGALDPDCADATAASCVYCNDTGSCDTTGGGCPGIIDPLDNSTCQSGPPPTWTCSASFYDAADGCDCGCGALDPDCADATAASCTYCNDSGSCDTTGAGCPGIIDPTDNSSCTAPPSWTCNPGYYDAADGCDCGCGAVDPDCADATAASCAYCNDAGSCDTTGAGCPGIIDPTDNSSCTAPPSWTCAPGYYNSGLANDCDCGCGAFDPDCADATVGSCDYCDDSGSCSTVAGCPGEIDATDNSTCSTVVPPTWTCSASFYGAADGCDCGCGELDPDCADATAASCTYCNDTGSCDTTGTGCPGIIDPVDNDSCVAPPSWTCSASYFDADDGCDCGCGAFDPDCADATAASCTYCNDTGSCDTTGAGCPGIIDPVDNAVCTGVPPTWTCDPGYYDSGLAADCDCGCGAFDPDCADATAASCNYCDDPGSCSTVIGCPGDIDPVDNSVCI
jgi:hypothetical protein